MIRTFRSKWPLPPRWTCTATTAPVLSLGTPARACDVCAIYTATALQETRTGLWLAVAEQFTRFDTLQEDGSKVANPGEHLNSSVTQVLLGYNFSPRWSMQVTVPFIARSFRRMETDGLDNGHESGVGDVSVLARYHAFSHVTDTTIARVSVLAGVKFPVGDSERLAEEHAETDGGEADEETSGVHGHDLALGTGSTDAVVGATAFASWRRLFASATLQYKLTSRGDAEYRYADELSYRAGPGVYAMLAPEYTLALQAEFSGESKGTDDQGGERVGDSAITALYVGPRLLLTYRRSLQAELGGELPLIQNNSALQLVPDYRIRAGLVWRF